MPILLLIVVGTAVGFIATRLLNVKLGLLPTVAIGVLGALVGGLIVRFLIALTSAASGIVGALIGAALLVWLVKIYQGKSK